MSGVPRWVVLVPLSLFVLTALAIFVGRRLKEAAVVVDYASSEIWQVSDEEVEGLELLFSAPAYGEER